MDLAEEWTELERLSAGLVKGEIIKDRKMPPIVIRPKPGEEVDYIRPLEFLYKRDEKDNNKMIVLSHNVFRDFGAGKRMHQNIVADIGIKRVPEGLLVYSEYRLIFLKEVYALFADKTKQSALKPFKIMALNRQNGDIQPIDVSKVNSFKVYFLLEGGDMEINEQRRLFRPRRIGQPVAVCVILNDNNFVIKSTDVIKLVTEMEEYVKAVMGAGGLTEGITCIYAKAVGQRGRY